MNCILRWYVFKACAGRTNIAEWHLRNQEFEVFVPKIRVTRRRGIKLTSVVEPMFMNYGFVSFDGSAAGWRKINGSRGVSYLVSSSGKALPLPQKFIEPLLACANKNSDGLVDFGQNLKVGGKVELMEGPFARQIGILQRLDSSNRVKVLIQMLGGEVPVSVPAVAVMAAD